MLFDFSPYVSHFCIYASYNDDGQSGILFVELNKNFDNFYFIAELNRKTNFKLSNRNCTLENNESKICCNS